MLAKWKDANLENKIFWVGIFLLPSSVGISLIILLPSLFLSFKRNYKKIFLNKFNVPFIIGACFIFLSCFFHNDQILLLKNEWKISYTWIGLANWIPLIICFLGFQTYIETPKDREFFGKIIISGTVPILISGFCQYFFKIHGPFNFLNGFIIWFQRPISYGSGLTSVFSNQNYAGSWLCIVLPFCIASLLINFKKGIKSLISIFFLFSITFSIILTTSRNAWGGLIISIPLVNGINSLLWLIPIILFFSLLISTAILNFVPNEVQIFVRNILPSYIWVEFMPSNFIERALRLDIWNTAIDFILLKPIFGWGAATFPVIYYSLYESYIFHPHNLVLELAISYGVPATLIIFITIAVLIVLSFIEVFIKRSFNDSKYFERAWFTSFFVLFCSQLLDVQYFDGRISLLFWILLGGLKEMIESRKDIVYLT